MSKEENPFKDCIIIIKIKEQNEIKNIFTR